MRRQRLSTLRVLRNLLLGVAFTTLSVGCQDDRPTVVVYSSLDQPYSQPVLDAFENTSGIRVLALFDTEADKTVGLARRLLDERSRPRADVFWNSEILQTLKLAEKGVLEAYVSPRQREIPREFRGAGALWHGFAARVRVLIYNRSLVDEADAPRSIADLSLERWRGRAVMALPLAGTTFTHAAALWARLGGDAAADYYRRLSQNDVRIVNGNAVVRDLVARGEVAIGITDTDDAHEGLRRGDPIAVVFPDQAPGFPGVDGALGAFLIPNTVAVVRGGPHPESARKLVDFLLSEEIERSLSLSGSAQIPVRSSAREGLPSTLGLPADLFTMEVRFEDAARALGEARPFLKELFLR